MAAEAAIKSADAAARQTELAREQFTASHRPLLVMRRPELGLFEPEQRMVIQFVVTNVGHSVAFDVMYRVDTILTEAGKNLFGLSRFRKTTKILEPREMGAYQNCYFEEDVLLVEIDFNSVQTMTHDLLFFGEISYRDAAGMFRRTGFVRRYDYEARRFCLTDDPEHEYQD